MPSEMTPASVADFLTFPFRGPKWQLKLLIAVLLGLGGMFTFFITTLFLSGYFVRLMRRIISEDAEPLLPDWYDWGRLFIDGLRLTAASLIYSLPLIILFSLGYASYFVPVLMSTSAETDEVVALAVLMGMGAGWCLFGIGMLLTAFLMFILPAALAHLARENSFAAAFHIRSWWTVFRRSFWEFVVAAVVLLGLVGLLSLVYNAFIFTLLLCWLAPFVLVVLMTYTSLVYFALVAQAYRDGMDRLSQPAALVESAA